MLRGTSHTLKLLLLEPVSDDSTSALCLGQRYPKRDALLGNNKGCWGTDLRKPPRPESDQVVA